MFFAWKHIYWSVLSSALRRSRLPGCGVKVGGAEERAVFDEGNFGANKGVSKGPQQPHGRSDEDRIKEKRPAQTIWKKGAKTTRAWKTTTVKTKRGKRTPW